MLMAQTRIKHRGNKYVLQVQDADGKFKQIFSSEKKIALAFCFLSMKYLEVISLFDLSSSRKFWVKSDISFLVNFI